VGTTVVWRGACGFSGASILPIPHRVFRHKPFALDQRRVVLAQVIALVEPVAGRCEIGRRNLDAGAGPERARELVLRGVLAATV
jgi:hypothetical protein